MAALVGAQPSEIVFTSGATESNNMALKGVALKLQSRGRHIVSSVVEHRSVITPLKYLERMGFETDIRHADHAIREDGEALNSRQSCSRPGLSR